MENQKFEYILRIGDNALILGQRLSAWCGHAPALEEDIALANTALDLIGQASLWLSYASEVEGTSRSADDLAFLRDSRAFRNVLLVEQPNGDYGQTLMRQFLFDAWHRPFLEKLVDVQDARIAEIAAKAVKEAVYHLERSSDLIVRLGGGTEERNARMQSALDLLWPFAGEFFEADAIDATSQIDGYGPDLSEVETQYKEITSLVFSEGYLTPADSPTRSGGKHGLHSEAFGHLLAEMQILQRSHPGVTW